MDCLNLKVKFQAWQKILHKHTEPVVQATVCAVISRKEYGDASLGLAAGFVFFAVSKLRNFIVSGIIK